MNASRIARFRSIALLLSTAALLSTATADARRAHFPREGVWRGVFDVNGDPLPFQFEIKGKRAGDATLTLINGARRDRFKVEQTAPDTLFVRMNTYDAAMKPGSSRASDWWASIAASSPVSVAVSCRSWPNTASSIASWLQQRTSRPRRI